VIDEDLRGFDPTKEGAGGPCARCGREQEPWRYSDVCQACLWDEGAVERVAEKIRAHRFHYADEDRLQRGLAALFGDQAEREVRLDSRSRIDLMVGRVGIEVKVAGKPSAVLRQVERYLASDQLDGLVLVTTRVRHRPPAIVNGKPVRTVSLAGGGL
jgi:hypothetical protein